MEAQLADAMKVGDVIQCSGTGVPPDLQDKYFIVREVGNTVTLSWPYVDQACTVLYVPRLSEYQTGRDWRAQCESIERREKKANRAMRACLNKS